MMYEPLYVDGVFTMPQAHSRLRVVTPERTTEGLLVKHEMYKVDGKWRHHLTLLCEGIERGVTLTRKQLLTVKVWKNEERFA